MFESVNPGTSPPFAAAYGFPLSLIQETAYLSMLLDEPSSYAYSHKIRQPE